MDTIRNPIEWGADQLRHAAHAVEATGEAVRGDEASRRGLLPRVRRIEIADLREVLRKGFEDFGACRSDVIFLGLVYPLIGLLLARFTFQEELLALLFPLASGFALLGPVAAIGLYEMSRQREQGKEPSWSDAFSTLASPSFGAILVLGLVLLALFFLWLAAAQLIYLATLGALLGPENPPASLGALLQAVATTGAGRTMAVVGIGVGFLFAVAVLAISVVAFPLLLDRKVGLNAAIATSLRVCAENPGPMAAWGLIVAGGLALGSLPLFLGLIVVMPVLGHATWHLYRRVVAH